MLREHWNAVHAYHQRPDQLVSIRPFSGVRPILDAFLMAAELEGESAGTAIMGARHIRDAPASRLDEEQASLGGPVKRVKKLVETGRASADIRDHMDSGERLNVLGQSDKGLRCVSSGFKCWNPSCDLRMIPHFPPTELAVLR